MVDGNYGRDLLSLLPAAFGDGPSNAPLGGGDAPSPAVESPGEDPGPDMGPHSTCCFLDDEATRDTAWASLRPAAAAISRSCEAWKLRSLEISFSSSATRASAEDILAQRDPLCSLSLHSRLDFARGSWNHSYG